MPPSHWVQEPLEIMLAEALFLAQRPKPQRGPDPDGHERGPESGPVAHRAIIDLVDHMAKAVQHFRHLPYARDHFGVGIWRATPVAGGNARRAADQAHAG